MNHYLQGTVTAVFSLALVACGGGGGGGGGTCGEVTNGGVCAESAECACGLTCISETCATSFGTPGVEPGDAPKKTYPRTSEAKSFCDALINQPCMTKEAETDKVECYDDLSKGQAKAKEAGCGSQYTSALNCIKKNLDCPVGTFFDDSMNAALEACGPEGLALEACEKDNSGSCGLGGSGGGCGTASPGDGGEPPFDCEVSRSEGSCSASAECSAVDGSDPPQYKCTCTGGLRDGDVFYGYASVCCDIGSYLEDACGFVPDE
jgi:hypothetical protein